MVKNVLFVDDEKSLLEGLKRSLRPFIHEFNMHFATNAAEALAVLAHEKIEIVVSDYKMPEVDGLELLEQVKKLYPDIKRVLLTGQSEKEIYERSQEIVHAYVSKPCSNDELMTALRKLV